jgi:drug/metabolite transporter (DMT)-like permease
MTEAVQTTGLVIVAGFTGAVNAIAMELFGFGWLGLSGGALGAIFTVGAGYDDGPPVSRIVAFLRCVASGFVGALVGTIMSGLIIHYLPFMQTMAGATTVVCSMIAAAAGWPLVHRSAKILGASLPRLLDKLLPKNDGSAP